MKPLIPLTILAALLASPAAFADAERQLQISDLLAMNKACGASPASAECAAGIAQCEDLKGCDNLGPICNVESPTRDAARCERLRNNFGGCVTKGLFRSRCDAAAKGELKLLEDKRDPGWADSVLHLGFSRALSPDRDGATTALVTASTAVRFVTGAPGVAGGAHLELGAATSGLGLLYDATLGLGVGSRLGDLGLATLTLNLGAGGITGQVPGAFEVPIELYVGVNVLKHLRVLAFVRDGWAFREARRDGSPHALFGDELTLGGGFRFGRVEGDDSRTSSTGFFLGATYRELMGRRFLGVMLGLEGSG